MKKVIIGFCIFIIFLTGCTKQKVSDIYDHNIINEESTVAKSDSSNEKVITFNYKNIVNEVTYVSKGETAQVESIDDYSFKMKEVRVVENVSDLSVMMNQSSEDRIRNWYYNIDNNNDLNEDGTSKPDKITNINRKFLLVKLEVTNNSSKEIVFNSMGFRVFNINRERNRYISLAEGFTIIDLADDEEVAMNHLTLKSGQTKEIVMCTLIPTEILSEYTMTFDGNDRTYKNIKTYGSSLDNLYTYYSVKGEAFPKGTKVFSLDID